MTEKTKAFTEFKPNEKQNIIKTISLIKTTESKKPEVKNFLGIKRKLFKKIKQKNGNKENKGNKKKNKNKKNSFLITKSMEYFINNTNILNNEICIICLEKISFKERHFLHCGHFFHCCCINKWISMDKNKCPTCKQDIECNKSFQDEESAEDDNDNNGNNIVINTSSDDSLSILYLYFLVIIIIFMFKGFCFRFYEGW